MTAPVAFGGKPLPRGFVEEVGAVVGDRLYAAVIQRALDPESLFNPGKIFQL